MSSPFYERLADHANLPYVSLKLHNGTDPVNSLASQLLSEQVCRRFRMIPIATSSGVVTVASADPFDEMSRDVASTLMERPVRVVVCAPDEIDDAIDRIFGAIPEELQPMFQSPEPALEDVPIEEIPTETGVPDLHLVQPAQGRLLGELLLERGLVTPEELEEALEIQDRSGSRLGEIVHHAGMVDGDELASVLADQFRVPLVDVTDVEPDAAAVTTIPEELSRAERVVPLAIDDEWLYVAVAEPLSEDVLGQLREHTDLKIRSYLAPVNAIDELLQRLHSQDYVRTARTKLLQQFPEDCANRVLTRGQGIFLTVLAIVVIVCMVIAPLQTVIGIMVVSIIFYTYTSIYKFQLIYKSLGRRNEITVSPEEIEDLDERTLPVYTILVPLYREAEVVPRLAGHIAAIDYPRAKLDVRLLCEQDDQETIDTIEAMDLPPHFKTVIVPEAQPKTKPKACNYGILQAAGEIVVIFDAEDRPDPDQLKKVVIGFRQVPENVVCVQCKLNYFNQDQNLLTRWFSTEYAMWFDLLLPGLDAADAPIPLGGTSNHFLADRLVEVGAWDPFNVTEDADLGLRLHKAGYETAMLDSTTLEEANSEVSNWIRQRSRWVKGYIQTYLVHMRHPLRLLNQIGIRSWLSFQVMVGGTVIFLLNPIFWGLTTLWLLTESDLIESFFPGFVFYAAAFQLFVGNFVFMYLNVAGSVQRGYFDLAKWALLSPLYWGLMSIGAWKGFIQLFYKPFYWEKTVHGLDTAGGATAPPRAAVEPQRERANEPTPLPDRAAPAAGAGTERAKTGG